MLHRTQRLKTECFAPLVMKAPMSSILTTSINITLGISAWVMRKEGLEGKSKGIQIRNVFLLDDKDMYSFYNEKCKTNGC